jgi:hypothetical protein
MPDRGQLPWTFCLSDASIDGAGLLWPLPVVKGLPGGRGAKVEFMTEFAFRAPPASVRCRTGRDGFRGARTTLKPGGLPCAFAGAQTRPAEPRTLSPPGRTGTSTMNTDSQLQQDGLDELKWAPAVGITQVGLEARPGIKTRGRSAMRQTVDRMNLVC